MTTWRDDPIPDNYPHRDVRVLFSDKDWGTYRIGHARDTLAGSRATHWCECPDPPPPPVDPFADDAPARVWSTHLLPDGDHPTVRFRYSWGWSGQVTRSNRKYDNPRGRLGFVPEDHAGAALDAIPDPDGLIR